MALMAEEFDVSEFEEGDRLRLGPMVDEDDSTEEAADLADISIQLLHLEMEARASSCSSNS